MTVFSLNEAPVGHLARVVDCAVRFLSKLFRSVAKSWMDWSKFEYELFRARSRNDDLRV